MVKNKTLKIDFVSFWPNFIKEDNYFYHLLNLKYKLIIDTVNPQLIFHSYDYSGKKEHTRFNKEKVLKVFYSGESVDPNFDDSNFSFTYRNLSDIRNFRLPLWAMHINWFDLKYKKNRDIGYHIKQVDLIKKGSIPIKPNKYFCSFLASQPTGRRTDFFPKLNALEKVDSGGRLFNNINKHIKGRGDQHWKYKFLENYKFNISFENSIENGYVSEKIIQPMSVNSIPIYWGTSDVKKDFNEDSFIYVNDFSNEEKLLDYIIQLNNNKEEYKNKLMEPWFHDNELPKHFFPENILHHFEENILSKLK